MAARILSELVELVERSGGLLRPGLRIVEREGQMGVHLDADADGADVPLMRIPGRLLVRTDGVGRTSLQGDVHDLLLALYDATGKLSDVSTRHPAAALRDEGALITAIQGLRPHFGRVWRTPMQVLIRTRTLEIGSPTSRQPVLMPLVELLNNHARGGTFRYAHGSLSVPVSRPGGGTECFADYGHGRDALDLVLDYGYLDTGVRFVQSAPLSVELPGAGRLSVRGVRPRPRHHLDPPTVRVTDGELTLSHITFDADHPERFRALVAMPLRAYLAHRVAPERVDAAADTVLDAIVDENRQRISALLDVRPSSPHGAEAARLVRDAALQHRHLLEEMSGAS